MPAPDDVPPHVQEIVDSYRWRSEKPTVFAFEQKRRSGFLVVGATTLTLTDATPSAVREVIVLAHIAEIHATKGSLNIIPSAGQAHQLSGLDENEVLTAIIERLSPPPIR